MEFRLTKSVIWYQEADVVFLNVLHVLFGSFKTFKGELNCGTHVLLIRGWQGQRFFSPLDFEGAFFSRFNNILYCQALHTMPELRCRLIQEKINSLFEIFILASKIFCYITPNFCHSAVLVCFRFILRLICSLVSLFSLSGRMFFLPLFPIAEPVQ